jgi:hypothetical protein
MAADVFVSMGTPATDQQRNFRNALREELVKLGLNPRTPGQGYAANAQPLTMIERCMRECDGAIVVAYERYRIVEGVEKPGGAEETRLSDVRFPTVWNHIEGALASAMELPLLVIAESGLKEMALLENRYNWLVLWIPLDPSVFQREDFSQILKDWKAQVEASKETKRIASDTRRIGTRDVDLEKESVADLIGRLRPAQVWTVLGALTFLVTGAFTLGRNSAMWTSGGQTAAAAVESAPSAERKFVGDSDPVPFLGSQIFISARDISERSDSAVIILSIPGQAPDTFALQQGASHTFHINNREYALMLGAVRGGDGRPGRADIIITPLVDSR